MYLSQIKQSTWKIWSNGPSRKSSDGHLNYIYNINYVYVSLYKTLSWMNSVKKVKYWQSLPSYTYYYPNGQNNPVDVLPFFWRFKTVPPYSNLMHYISFHVYNTIRNDRDWVLFARWSECLFLADHVFLEDARALAWLVFSRHWTEVDVKWVHELKSVPSIPEIIKKWLYNECILKDAYQVLVS